MNPEAILQRLSVEGRDLLDEDLRDLLWRNVPTLADAVRVDLAMLSGGAFLESATIYVGDSAFRQGATAIVLDFRFDLRDPFRVRVTALVDHGITLHVASAPIDPRFDDARSRIDSSADARTDGLPVRDLRRSND